MTDHGAVPWMRETEVFTSGAEGYHTFRIPSLVVAGDGTILAFCEGRVGGFHDHQALYVLLKRSTDNGVTWEPMQTLVGDGERTYHNPTAVVDRETDTVWMAYNIDAHQTFVLSSTDSGANWSEPVEITDGVVAPHMSFYVVGPGHGNQRKDGTLVIPGDHRSSNRLDAVFSHSHVIYSNDHGVSWKPGGVTVGGTDECEVVETRDGQLYMAIRGQDRTQDYRLCARSNDGGLTWSDIEELTELPDPRCQASIVRFTDRDIHDKDRILFSNVASSTRDTMTVRVSYDECRTWATSKVIYPGPAAYSDMAVAPDMSICCLYERGVSGAYEGIRLAQFNIEWLTDGADHLADKDP